MRFINRIWIAIRRQITIWGETTKGFLHYLKDHAMWPLVSGLGIEILIVIIEKIHEGQNGKSIWELAASPEVIAIALAIYIIHSIIDHFIYYGRFHNALKYLNKLLNEVPKPFKKYGQQRILDNVKTIAVRLSILADGGELRTDLENKIRLITNLIDNFPKEPIERFWATSFDKPSTLMQVKYSSFFEAQRQNLDKIENWKDYKRRVVILSIEDMLNEIASEIDGDSNNLTNFINWHHKNHFQLRFLFNKNQYFENKVNSIIGKLTAKDNALTDFAIIGKKDDRHTWIYGELTTKKEEFNLNEVETERNRSEESTIQLYRGERETDIFIVAEYVKLYKSLWDDWKNKTLFSLTAKQTLSEIYRKKKIEELKDERDVYYSGYYGKPINEVTYQDFLAKFNTVRSLNIKAVDLMSLCVEDELQIWKADDFSVWYQSNMDAIKIRECRCERIYVINQNIPNPYIAEEQYERVFEPQIKAGVILRLVKIEDLNEADIPLHDFVFGVSRTKDKTGEFCVSVDLFEAFEEKHFTIKNLELPIRIKTYNRIYLEVKSKSRIINKLSKGSVVQFLCNLKW